MSCETCKHEFIASNEYPCAECVHNYMEKYEPVTNYDRIKNMSVEELADFIVGLSPNEKFKGLKFLDGVDTITFVNMWLEMGVSAAEFLLNAESIDLNTIKLRKEKK